MLNAFYSGSGGGKPRDKTRVVTYRVPHNAAVQIYDYKDKKARYECYLRMTCKVIGIAKFSVQYCVAQTFIV